MDKAGNLKASDVIKYLRAAANALDAGEARLLTAAEYAVEEMRFRAKRAALFGEDLFWDPAWAILLDLFVAEDAGKNTSISSACAASGIAATTALRYVGALEQAGHIARIPHPDDRRQCLLRMTDAGRSKMLRYFAKGVIALPLPEDLESDATAARSKPN